MGILCSSSNNSTAEVLVGPIPLFIGGLIFRTVLSVGILWNQVGVALHYFREDLSFLLPVG